jgi:hypothetical protein
MTRLLIVPLCLLLTACAVGSMYRPDFTKAPSAGMTKADVRAQWGIPYETSWSGDVDIWTYRRSYGVATGFGSYRNADWYTVTFYQGKVVGAAW